MAQQLYVFGSWDRRLVYTTKDILFIHIRHTLEFVLTIRLKTLWDQDL